MRAARYGWRIFNPIMVDGEVVEIGCQAFGITDMKESSASC